MNEQTHPSVVRDQLVSDMKAVIVDAEALLQATAEAAGERVGALRTRAQQTLTEAKAKLAQLDDDMVRQAKDAARTADRYVRDNPWGAVGIAAAAGVVIGLLISRR
jgi:ElaB/YqjD/DUF883 family membrane-anchored ribosome-binding protein